MAAEVIANARGLKIANLEALPRGTGARYIEVIRDPFGGLIAKAWKRTLPKAGIVVDLDAPKLAAEAKLIEMGAVREKRENRFGETKSGWWIDGVYLAPAKDAVHALDIVEGR